MAHHRPAEAPQCHHYCYARLDSAGLEEAGAEPAIRAVVLTGAGEKAFCAGGDLQQGTSVFSDRIDEPSTDFGRLARVARRVGKPIVARINGAWVAGGMGLMALCDLVIAADHARFGLPEAKVGVFPHLIHVYCSHLILPGTWPSCAFSASLSMRSAPAKWGWSTSLPP